MPTIEEIIEAQRVKLAAGQYGVLSRIAGAYKQAAATASQRLETTTSELTRQRMSILLSGIEDELTKAAGKTIPLIKGQQAAVNLEAGKDFAELLKHFELAARIDPLANERMFAALTPESPLAELLGKANMAGLTAARMALFTGVALGDNPLKIAPKLREALDIPRWRAQTIARTEVLRSYRGSIRSRMKQQGFGHWRWISARGRRTCAMCWAQHGKIFPVEESMGTHPNCRCSQAPLGDSTEVVVNGEQDFANLSAGAQREVLGSAKFNAYKAGAINLSNLVGTRTDARWGTVRFEKSLINVLGSAAKPFYKGGRSASNFERQMLIQREKEVAAAEARVAAQRAELQAALARQQAAREALAAAQASRPFDPDNTPVSREVEAKLRAAVDATREAPTTAKKNAAIKQLANAVNVLYSEWGFPTSWSGDIKFSRVRSYAGVKNWNCDITMSNVTQRPLNNVVHTMNHEMAHAIGKLNPREHYTSPFSQFLEEAVTETFGRAASDRLYKLGLLKRVDPETLPSGLKWQAKTSMSYEGAVQMFDAIARKQGKTGLQLAIEVKKAMAADPAAHTGAARQEIVFRGWAAEDIARVRYHLKPLIYEETVARLRHVVEKLNVAP